MTSPVGIESMHFEFDGQRPAGRFAPVLVGVVGSGNLEVLIEAANHGRCELHIDTSARGFRPIWSAVAKDFHDRHGLSGLRVTINDMGATPAVVSLRLDQAVAGITPETP